MNHTLVVDLQEGFAKIIREVFLWNYSEITSLFSGKLWPIKVSKLNKHTDYLVYFFILNYLGVTLLKYFIRYIQSFNEKVYTYELHMNGKVIPNVRTSNKNGEPFELPDKEMTDMSQMLLKATQLNTENKIEFFDHSESYSSFGIYIAKVTQIVSKYVPEKGTFMLYGQFSRETCAALIGLCSTGRKVAFSSTIDTTSQFAEALKLSHSRCILIKKNKLGKLEEALRTERDIVLRTVIMIDTNIDIDSDDDSMENEDRLSDELGLQLISLSCALDRIDIVKPVQVCPDPLADEDAIILYRHTREIRITHRNIVTSCFSLIQQLQLTSQDSIVLEHKSYISSISLFLSCLYLGMTIVEAKPERIQEKCVKYNPTLISASQESLTALSKTIPPFTILFQMKMTLKQLLFPYVHLFHLSSNILYPSPRTNFGANLRCILSFYCQNPLSPHTIYTLLYGLNVPVSLIYCPGQASGPATISINKHIFMKHGYMFSPFPATYFRINNHGELEISGDTVTVTEDDTERDCNGLTWYNTRMHAALGNNGCIIQRNRPYSSLYSD
ncbi:hypothetical protein WA158_006329 [Blastocystis sp. Blastoise]